MGKTFEIPIRESQLKAQTERAETERINATITAAINNEETARKTADDSLKEDIIQISSDLTVETATRSSEDAAIRRELAVSISAEQSARTTFDAAIKASLESAKTDFNNAIKAERDERIASDTAIVNQLTSKYDGKVTDLTAAINNEITQRQAGDNQVRTDAASSISAEAKTRDNADKAIYKRIDEVEAEIEHYEDFKPPTETRPGEHGLVPAPPPCGTDTKMLLTHAGWEELKSTSIYVGAIPSQNGTPRYTGNNITPDWLNYEAEKLQISGETSATNVGEYTVNFTPIGLHCWSDGTRTARSVKWKIYPQVVTIPTAAVTSYGYSGSNITVGISGYNSNACTQGGTVTAKDVGNYTATYTLKSTTNYVWSDNTTSQKSISWQITAKTIAKPTASKTSFDYNGNSQSLSVSNYDSAYMTFSGSDTATAAGSYTATYTLKDSKNIHWSDNSTAAVNISWKINKKTLARPTATKTEFDYTGNQITLDVSNYDANYMTRGGTYQATAEGSYTVTYTLKNSSVTWSDGKSDVVSISWKIASSTIAKPAISGDTSFVYTGSSVKPTITGYDSTKMTMTGSDTAVNVGTYTITYTLKDKTNTKWADNTTADVKLTWTITRKPLTEAQSTFSQKGTLTYTGNSQNVTIDGYNSAYHDLSSTTSATNAGSYTAKVTPKSNYAWSDGKYAAKSVTWKIGKKTLAKPTAAKTAFEYDGAEKVLSISNYNSSYMTQEGTTSASAKGGYSVKYTLNDTANTCWADSTTTAVTINWSIGAKSIAKPKRTDSQTFTYDGNAKTITVSGYDSSTMTFSGTLSETNAGDYKATYSLKDKTNTSWDDGTTADFSISWSIAKVVLTEAQSTFSQNGTLTYNRQVQTVSISGYDSRYHVLGGTTQAKWAIISEGAASTAQTIGGKYVTVIDYEATVTPNSNYLWHDGTSASKIVKWQIQPLKLDTPKLEGETSFKYDGNSHTVKIAEIPNIEYIQFYNLTATNVGTYYAQFTINQKDFELIEGTNYYDGCCFTLYTSTMLVIHSTRSNVYCQIGTWEITSGDGITKPTLTKNSVEWTGGNVSPTIANVNTSVMSKTAGSDTATAIGTYTITYALKDKSNTKWSDGTTNDVVLTWYVTRKKLTAAQSAFSQSNAFTYDGTVKNITTNLSGYNSTYHDLSSETTATNAGTYTVKVTPKSTYCWSDGTYATKSVTWSVTPKRLTKPTLSNTTFTYDGSSKSPTINNYDSTYENKTGSDTAVNAGSYTLDFTLKNTTNTTWADSSTGTVSLGWTINPIRLTKPSLTNTSFTYDGNEHAPTVNNFNSEYMAQHNTIASTNAAPYTLSYTLRDTTNYTWADSTTSEVVLTWEIVKATPTMTLSASKVYLDGNDGLYNSDAGTFTEVDVTYNGDGAISVTSSQDGVIGTYYNNGSYVQVKLSGTYGVQKNATITVSAAAGKNYNAISKTFTTSWSNIPELKNCTWAQIKAVIKSGKASLVWDEGDISPNIYVEGKVGTIDIGWNYLARILGFDHNLAVENSDCSHTIHFVVDCKDNDDIKPIAFFDNNYNEISTDGTKYFQHVLSSDTTNATATDSALITRCTEFYNCLPSDLKNVIVTTTKIWRDPAKNASHNSKIWLLSPSEMHGSSSMNMTADGYGITENSSLVFNEDKQYAYFVNGNTRAGGSVCYHNNLGKTGYHWYRGYQKFNGRLYGIATLSLPVTNTYIHLIPPNTSQGLRFHFAIGG